MSEQENYEGLTFTPEARQEIPTITLTPELINLLQQPKLAQAIEQLCTQGAEVISLDFSQIPRADLDDTVQAIMLCYITAKKIT